MSRPKSEKNRNDRGAYTACKRKEAFKRACETEGITVSYAVRTFIDTYLRRSRSMRLRLMAKDTAGYLIKRPVKTSVGAAGGFVAIALGMLAVPSASYAGDYVEPLAHAHPFYPEAMAAEQVSAECDSLFDITASGYVVNLTVKCGHPGFSDSARQAISALRFAPKIVDGVAVTREGVSYPLSYLIHDEDGNPVAPRVPDGSVK